MKNEMSEQEIQSLLDELEGKVAAYNSVPDSVSQHLVAAGLPSILTPPGSEPQLPEDVSVLDIKKLNSYYDSFARYYDYIGRALADAERKFATAKRLVKLLTSVLHFRYKADSRCKTAEDREHAATLDWQFIKADAQLCFFEGVVSALNLRKSNIGQGRDRIFREISRRTRDNSSFSKPTSLLGE